jgi:3-oxoacyl-(acyl-carrier-protein) synthase
VTPLRVTGLGVVSALGIGREAFFRAIREPRLLEHEPLHPAETFDSSAYPEACVAEVRGFDPAKYLGDKGLRTLDRLTKLLIVGTRLTMQDAGLKKDGQFVATEATRVGLCASNAYGSLEAITELDRVATLEDARYINPAKFPNTVANSAAGYASIWEDIRALNVAVSDGNCGALDAVACADVFIQSGRADTILVGGAEAMSEGLFLAFHKLGALDPRTRLGEAAVLLAMEPEGVARARGARGMADVIGYGTAFVPPESERNLIVASDESIERAIRSALADARLAPRDVDVVASGVSGLRAFDRAELAGIERVLGKETCVAAPKALYGETLGAGGAMAMATALAWFDGAEVAPVVRGNAPTKPNVAVVTSMGFYGNASAVVLRRISG